MMKSKKIQISRMLLLKSGKFAYCNFDLREPVHLSGSNRTGKTSLKGNNLSLPQGDFSKLLYEGLTKKERRNNEYKRVN